MEGRKELYNRLTFSAAVDFIASQKQVASRCDEKKKTEHEVEQSLIFCSSSQDHDRLVRSTIALLDRIHFHQGRRSHLCEYDALRVAGRHP